jgi:hypothetical protein
MAATGGLNPEQMKAMAAGGAAGEIQQRYEEAIKSRSQDMQQQEITNRESARTFEMGEAGKNRVLGGIQTGVSAVGAAGTLGMGYSAASKAGLFGSTTPAYQSGLSGVQSGQIIAGQTPTGFGPTVEAAGTVGAVGTGAATTYGSTGLATGSGLAIGEGGGVYSIGTAATEYGSTAAGTAASTAEAGSIWESISAGAGYVGEAAVAAWVLCSELVRQGGLEASIVDDEWEYIRGIITDQEYAGYRIIADPLVKLMQISPLFTSVIAPFIRSFAYEMASRVNKDIKGNRLGKVILFFGLPLCRICAPEARKVEV